MTTAEARIYVGALQRKSKAGGNYWQLYWKNPMTGKRATRNVRATGRRDAMRQADLLEAELNGGVLQTGDSDELVLSDEVRQSSTANTSPLWTAFVEQYGEAEFGRMKPNTVKRFNGVFGVFARHAAPRYLSDITTTTLDRYKNKLRKLGRSESTIASHVRHLKTALNWAKARKLISELPDFGSEMRKVSMRSDEAMRGRPITEAEFELMVQVIPQVITRNGTARELGLTDHDRVGSWEHLLRGLWLSGLRSGEAYALRWDENEPGCLVNQTGDHWSIRFPKGFQKNSKRQDHPITPDFQDFLQQTPIEQRSGFVFKPKGLFRRPTKRQIERIVRDFGRSAWIRISDVGEKDSFAGCHTLRRSFGTRWSKRVTPSILRRLMRHSSIVTTERFYISHDINSVAEELHRALKKAK